MNFYYGMSVLNKFSKKIEAIRQEPEHIRLRYVWGSVFATMILVLAIWFFSISIMLNKNNSSTNTENSSLGDLKQQLQSINQSHPQTPSLGDYADQPLNIDNSGVVQDNSIAPADNSTDVLPEVPQSQQYSDLQNSNTQ